MEATRYLEFILQLRRAPAWVPPLVADRSPEELQSLPYVSSLLQAENRQIQHLVEVLQICKTANDDAAQLIEHGPSNNGWGWNWLSMQSMGEDDSLNELSDGETQLDWDDEDNVITARADGSYSISVAFCNVEN
jgi:hypothetical protein